MNIALIIQEKLLKNSIHAAPLLSQEGWTYNKKYKEYYKIIDKGQSYAHLYPLVEYPNCIEIGEINYISSLIKEIKVQYQKTRRHSIS